jgi:hypothetical protein
VKIKLLLPIRGTVESIYTDVMPGDIIDIEPVKAAGWVELKWAAYCDPSTPVTERCLRDPGTEPGIGATKTRFAHY